MASPEEAERIVVEFVGGAHCGSHLQLLPETLRNRPTIYRYHRAGGDAVLFATAYKDTHLATLQGHRRYQHLSTEVIT